MASSATAPPTNPAVISRGTLPDQRVVGSQLSRLPAVVAEAELPGPALLVVGDVVRLSDRIAWFGPGDQPAVRTNSTA